MDILVILQTALLYVIRGILQFLDKEGSRLTPDNITAVQNQVMSQIEHVDVFRNFSDVDLLKKTVEELLVDEIVVLPDIVNRSSWNARPSKSQKSVLDEPLHYVVIDHNGDKVATSKKDCLEMIKSLQDKQMTQDNKNDITYNFVLCGDQIYEGVGWDSVMQHTPEFCKKSLGIALIGTSSDEPPKRLSHRLLELLLNDGMQKKKLASDYKVYSYSQLQKASHSEDPTATAIKSLSHWSEQTD